MVYVNFSVCNSHEEMINLCNLIITNKTILLIFPVSGAAVDGSTSIEYLSMALLELLSDIKHLNSRDFLGTVQLALVLGTI